MATVKNNHASFFSAGSRADFHPRTHNPPWPTMRGFGLPAEKRKAERRFTFQLSIRRTAAQAPSFLCLFLLLFSSLALLDHLCLRVARHLFIVAEGFAVHTAPARQ